ncbi:hypothetical protein [Epilithonimonas lactis]|uniref:Uncharacterized protein n=1 Tax=Epilithonimonas lactis TaxID=421072 RepID=A0A085BFG1_9FLAO|nr:hypothetical protein [Epilithonimonas lactis]KFC21206.1 hypothetical protein IO89_13455 [Epilithonimonas lactis]SEP76983.1 hypothetical protein SAMN04488097_0590 [Epilithonimonas lactis]
MKLKTLLPFFITLLFLTSCDRIIDNYYEQQAQENYTSPYMGKWVGNYTGQGNGTLIISVAKSGSITGNYGPNNDMVLGFVLDDGALTPVISETPIFTMYGSLNTKKGTWKNGDLTGDWTLTKQ